MKSQNGFEVDYQTAYRSIKDLEEEKNEAVLKSYSKFQSYFEWNIVNNPGTHADIQLNGSELRQSYLCLNICAKVFSLSLPIIALDGCHVKNGSNYTLLTATGINSNSEIYPIAIGLVFGECQETWTYFIKHLDMSLSLRENVDLVILSDREKGLALSVESVLPKCHHSFCLYHIGKNIKTKFRSNYNPDIFKAARATTIDGFKSAMDLIEAKDSRVFDYLNQIPKENWAEAYFGKCRYGNLTSNIAEAMNSSLLKIRNLHPFELVYEFVNSTYDNFKKKFATYKDMSDLFPPYFKKKILPMIEESRHLRVLYTDDNDIYRVSKDNSSSIFKIVDIKKRTCTCTFMQHNGFPCSHMMTCIFLRGERLEDHIENHFKLANLKLAYSTCFKFCDIELLETKTMEPMIKIRKRGRPKKKRVRSEAEKIFHCTT